VSETFIDANGVRLCHQAFTQPSPSAAAGTSGAAGDPLVVLIMGLGLDLLWWREDFCRAIAARGLRVVRFDNRDVGRSTAFAGPGASATQVLTRRARPVYTLADMADDVAGLVAALDERGAHVVGASLGACVAQEVAIRHPHLTRSLVSIMGRPGDGRSGRVTVRGKLEFLRGGDLVATFRRIGSAGRGAADDEDVRVLERASARREQGDGSGPGRQLAAMIGERDRTPGLRGLDVPALVVHGDRDAIIAPSGGRATAAAIPNARLLVIEGMGHDLPRYLWPPLLGAMTELWS